MNILMFNYEYPPLGGGGGVIHALVAEELARRHRVVVVTSRASGQPAVETRDGVEVHRVPVLSRGDLSAATLLSLLSFPPGAWRKGAELLRRERFDVVNSHFAVPTGPGSLPVAKVGRIPHVLSLHGGDIYDPSKRLSPHRLPVVRGVVTQMMRRSEAVVAQSQNTRDNAWRYYGYRGPIEIIPLGIRQPRFAPATRAELGLPEDVFLAVTVGRLVKRKAIDVLLTALARPECAGVHLAVVGAGPELEPWRALAAALGIAERVRFLGRVSEEAKWQILACADVYASTTMHEGFGLVYLEAMAAGLPVITYDHGGQTDFLVDGVTGFLVPAGDPDRFVSALSRLAASPDLAARMRAENLRRAPSHRVEHCASAYEALFAALAEGRAVGGDAPRASGPAAPSGPGGVVRHESAPHHAVTGA